MLAGMAKHPFSRLFLRLMGWAVETPAPSLPKYVGLAVPHTSNWDGLLLVLATRAAGLRVRWLIKSEWTRSPLGPLLRWTGAIGVDRSGPKSMVPAMIEAFQKADELVLMIPPEGTRSHTEHWKSGFFHIAKGAGVPVVPCYLDFGRKRAGFGPPVTLTGDARADMAQIRAFYEQQAPRPHTPARFGPIRLRDEETPPKA
jgi:1-acyl-sn-glycerol-3-phosphate acyltransferase